MTIIRGTYPKPLEQLTEESFGGVAVSTRLDQYIEHVAVLIDHPPQVMLGSVYANEHLVQMPLVAGLCPSSAQLIGVGLPKRGAPPGGSSRGSPRTPRLSIISSTSRKLSGNRKYNHTQWLMISAG